jgi:hypothetical protein
MPSQSASRAICSACVIGLDVLPAESLIALAALSMLGTGIAQAQTTVTGDPARDAKPSTRAICSACVIGLDVLPAERRRSIVVQRGGSHG